MKKEELKNKTVTELESEIKKIKATSGIIFGISFILLAITIYGVIINHEYAIYFGIIVIVVIGFANIPSGHGSIKKIKTELESRKNNS